MDEFEFLRELGRGTFGVVRLVRERSAHASGGIERECVVKEVDLSLIPASLRADAENEAEVLRSFEHPHIIKCYRAFLDGGRLHIVMEYASGGDLTGLIEKRRLEGRRFARSEALRMIGQCCSALEYIHGKNILHRDVKGQNIFLMDIGTIKLGDFGIAKVLESHEAFARTIIGTPNHLAPEVIDSMPYGPKADMWSMGIVFYQMLAFELPFKASSVAALAVKIVSCEPLPPPDDCGEDVRELVLLLLSRDPCLRPSAGDVCAMPLARRFHTISLPLPLRRSDPDRPLLVATVPMTSPWRRGDGSSVATVPMTSPWRRGDGSSPTCWAAIAGALSKGLTGSNTLSSPVPSVTTPAALTPCGRLLASLGISPNCFSPQTGQAIPATANGAAKADEYGFQNYSRSSACSPGHSTPLLLRRCNGNGWAVGKDDSRQSPNPSPNSLDGLLALLQDSSPETSCLGTTRNPSLPDRTSIMERQSSPCADREHVKDDVADELAQCEAESVATPMLTLSPPTPWVEPQVKLVDLLGPPLIAWGPGGKPTEVVQPDNSQNIYCAPVSHAKAVQHSSMPRQRLSRNSTFGAAGKLVLGLTPQRSATM